MGRQHIHFITGKLAAFSLRNVLEPLAASAGFDYSVEVLNISVAALMTTDWIARRWHVHEQATEVLLPGLCGGDLTPLRQQAGIPVHRGPKDLHELPDHFGQGATSREVPRAWDIEILAEINHVPRLSLKDILLQAEQLRSDGADVIDLGCDPGPAFPDIGPTVRALKRAGHRVSIDSMNPREIAPAVEAGAELVLSVNADNRAAAVDWGCEVVAMADDARSLAGLDQTIDFLEAHGVKYRLDPILEPIGFGFAASLGRYLEARRRWPETPMMMGIGNLTELTEVDTAGVNMLLIGFCQELQIRSVLTTQVIPWADSCVREITVARRLSHHAVTRGVLPKHLDASLVMLRDAPRIRPSEEELDRLAAEIRDPNFRLFAGDAALHLVSAALHLRDTDPYDLFEQLLKRQPKNLDSAHAFYLGYELAKAVTAQTLGKNYRQDQPLDWGLLTREEKSHREQQLRDRQRDAPRAGDEDS